MYMTAVPQFAYHHLADPYHSGVASVAAQQASVAAVAASSMGQIGGVGAAGDAAGVVTAAQWPTAMHSVASEACWSNSAAAWGQTVMHSPSVTSSPVDIKVGVGQLLQRRDGAFKMLL